MGDVVSIELLLDDETEASVRADWERLARSGHSSLAAHTAASNRPHITVLARPSLPIVDFAQAAALLPASITFGAPIVFEHGDRGVLARLVVLDGPLLAIYNAVRAAEPQSRRAAEPQSRSAAGRRRAVHRSGLMDPACDIGPAPPPRVAR